MFCFEIIKRFNREQVFFVRDKWVLSAKSYVILWRYKDGKVKVENCIKSNALASILSCCRITKHGLRLGIHNILLLNDTSILVSCKKKILLKTPESDDFRVVHQLRYGNKPALKGFCIDDDGLIYFGEYSVNQERLNPVAVFCSSNQGRSFEKISEFAPGEVRHIHFIQWDKFEKCLWMGTGDNGDECRILRSFDGGKNWSDVGRGSQLWRSVGIIFTDKYLYWGTDAGGDYAGKWQNRIVRMDRATGKVTELFRLPGPCHSMAVLRNGLLAVATGVERGENEQDGKAHIFISRDGESWYDVFSWRKDRLPLKISFGLIHFPHGLENSDLLHFTTLGLAGAGEAYWVVKISEV